MVMCAADGTADGTADRTREQGLAEELTVLPRKRQLYLQDIGFREALNRLAAATSGGLIEYLRHLSCFVIKPDGIACRKGMAILDFMRSNAVAPLAVRRVRLSHSVVQSIWRYQWNRATVDRARLSTMMATSADSLAVIVEDTDRVSPVPLTVRLWARKGSAFAAERQPHHLRTHLGINGRFFGYAHFPDEPADLLRELGLLFPGDGLTRLFLGLKRSQDVTAQADRELRELESESAAAQIDEARAWERLSARIQAGEIDPAMAGQLGADPVGGRAISLAGIPDACFFRTDGGLDWDLLTVAAARVLQNLPGVDPLIDSGEAESAVGQWRTRKADRSSSIEA
jgi:hypothetical protein